MVQINFAKREINCKLVYYGPGLSGKTTNLEVVHKKAPAAKRGDLTSIATEGDRTLFFDYMPLELGKVGGMNTKFQLYTVPGQVYYNATRKLVLQGADGVVFVADSQPDKMEENLESLQNLEDNLKEQGLDAGTMPLVLQWNKRDLPNVLSVAELEKKINRFGAPTFEAVAVTGDGVFQTLKKLAQMVLEKLNKEYGLQPPEGEAGAATSKTGEMLKPQATGQHQKQASGTARPDAARSSATATVPKPAVARADAKAETPAGAPSTPPGDRAADEPKREAPPPRAEPKPERERSDPKVASGPSEKRAGAIVKPQPQFQVVGPPGAAGGGPSKLPLVAAIIVVLLLGGGAAVWFVPALHDVVFGKQG